MMLLKGHASGTPVWSIAFAPDSQQLASGGNDRTLRLWDLRTGKGRLLQRSEWPTGLAFSPCGQWLAYGWGESTFCLSLRDHRAADLGGDAFLPSATVFSPSGDLLVTAGAMLRLYDARRWVLVSVRQDDPRMYFPATVAFRPDGTVLATAHTEGCAVRLWQVGTWAMIREFHSGKQSINSLAFSPCGRWLVGTGGPTLWVWDAETGAVVQERRIDRRHFQSCAFSPCGRLLAAAHNDGRVRLYEAATWGEVTAYDWGVGPVLTVAFAPDGMKAGASGKTGKIVVWDVDY